MKTKPSSLFSLVQLGTSIQKLNKDVEFRAGLSLVQWTMLSILIDRPGASANDLAIAIGITPGSLTQTLKRLERKKCIFVGTDPKDSRKKTISITRSGRNLLSEMENDLKKWTRSLKLLEKEMIKLIQFLDAGLN